MLPGTKIIVGFDLVLPNPDWICRVIRRVENLLMNKVLYRNEVANRAKTGLGLSQILNYNSE